MRSWAILLTLSAVACQGYRAGSYHDGFQAFSGERRAVGCLDVAVAALRDAEAEGPAAQIAFGNKCDTATAVDLQAVRVVARYADGETETLEPRDPRQDIRRGLLDARSTGLENIEYEAPLAGAAAPVELCIDVAGLDARRPSPEPVVACVPAVVATPAAVAEVRQ